jgi:hypothetical protein
MARQTVTLTDSWQQVASGKCVITVLDDGNGAIFFNETATDVDALPIRAKNNQQFAQASGVDTFMKASGDGWEILVDGVI